MGSIMDFLTFVSLTLLAYMLGSIPFGVVLTRLFTDIDLSTQGSGNIGATNVLRCAGIKLGLLTLLLDISKGSVPVYLTLILLNIGQNGISVYPYMVALCAFLGHLFPLYFGLRSGGKGVATAWGCFLVLSPLSGLLVLLIFALIVLVFKRVSLASLTAALALPPTMGFITTSLMGALFSALMALGIVYRHKPNIVRLIQGKEPPIWSRKP
jgi:glycerol-3-phosphate acyltransferase PlsY